MHHRRGRVSITDHARETNVVARTRHDLSRAAGSVITMADITGPPLGTNVGLVQSRRSDPHVEHETAVVAPRYRDVPHSPSHDVASQERVVEPREAVATRLR
jgi:hypothetical protein